MNKHLPNEIAFLNRKGSFLRRLILEFSDEELRKLFPSPSKKSVRDLIQQCNKNYLGLAQRN